MPTKVLFKEMTWPEVQERVRRCDIAIIPLGSMEPQPPILPVGADTFVIEGLVQRGAQMVADEVGAVVLPAFDFGSPTGPALTPEALNLPWDILMDLLEYTQNLIKNGDNSQRQQAYQLQTVLQSNPIKNEQQTTNSKLP